MLNDVQALSSATDLLGPSPKARPAAEAVVKTPDKAAATAATPANDGPQKSLEDSENKGFSAVLKQSSDDQSGAAQKALKDATPLNSDDSIAIAVTDENSLDLGQSMSGSTGPQLLVTGMVLPTGGDVLPTMDGEAIVELAQIQAQNGLESKLPVEQIIQASSMLADEAVSVADADLLLKTDLAPDASLLGRNGITVSKGPAGMTSAQLAATSLTQVLQTNQTELATASQQGLATDPALLKTSSGQLTEDFDIDGKNPLVANLQKSVTGQQGESSANATPSRLQELLGSAELAKGLGDINAAKPGADSSSLLHSMPVSYRMVGGQPVAASMVSVQVGQAGWDHAVAEKLVWFSMNSVTSAQMDLDPPDLGPLQVRIKTEGDQTIVNFTSSHGAVREALDLSIPRLKEMFEANGLSLGSVDVSEKSPEQSQEEMEEQGEAGEDALADNESLDTPESALAAGIATSMRLVDYYA